MYKNLEEEFKDYYNILGTNLTSFERDYDDIQNFYSLIQIGTRELDNELLVEKCWALLNKYRDKPNTPDYGGALCVIGYNDKELNLESWLNYLKKFCENYKERSKNPHYARWYISLNYLAGNLTNNILYYRKCYYNITYKKFNMLILTKKLAAAEKIARYLLDFNLKQEAKDILIDAIELYKRALNDNLDTTIGKSGTYIYFSCVEIAELSDLASQLVKFLQNIDLYYDNREEFEESFDSRRWGLYKYCKELENKINKIERR